MPIQVKIFSKTKDMYRERTYATHCLMSNIMETLFSHFMYIQL